MPRNQFRPDTARDLKAMCRKVQAQLLVVESLARTLGLAYASTDRIKGAREVFPEILRTIDANTKPVAPDDPSMLYRQEYPGVDDTPPHGTTRPAI